MYLFNRITLIIVPAIVTICITQISCEKQYITVNYYLKEWYTQMVAIVPLFKRTPQK